MTTGIVQITRQVPKNERDWSFVLQRLNKAIKFSGDQAVLAALTTISERTGTDLDTLLQYIGDAGRAIDQRFLPMVNFGNVSSVQDTDPLGASAGASTADISVAAHTLHTDFADIQYNSGAIVGLSLNTRYYVYVDDPNNLGGAVTYIATASKPNVPANSGRYLVGSIVTPIAANTATIDDATSANPIVFTTTAAHGWNTGDFVDFAGLPGDFAALNSGIHTITVIDSDEFSIATDGSAFAAYTSGGTATRVVDDGFPDYGGGGGGALP
jgi:hypothetical protein